MKPQTGQIIGIVMALIFVGLLVYALWPKEQKCITTQCEKEEEELQSLLKAEHERRWIEYTREKEIKVGEMTCIQKGTDKGLSIKCQDIATTTATSTMVLLKPGQTIIMATSTIPLSIETDLFFAGMSASSRITEKNRLENKCVFNLFCPKVSYDEYIHELLEHYKKLEIPK